LAGSDYDHPAFKGVVTIGKPALPVLHSRIGENWGIIGMIWSILSPRNATDTGFDWGKEAHAVPQEMKGQFAEVCEIYEAWGKEQGYDNPAHQTQHTETNEATE
jgi:hypothetical protein